VLKPFHDLLLSGLRKIPRDCTLDQRKIGPLVREKAVEGKPLYSLDLTAATDRLPLSVQTAVIGCLFSGSFGPVVSKTLTDAWSTLIRGIPYMVKEKTVSQHPIYYKVGQGMGLYTSWAALAWTNHVLVKYAAFRVGISFLRDYLVLGDDIIIANKAVASEYKKVLDIIGVEISLAKSVVPLQSSSDGGELASRLIKGDLDYSPLPIGLLLRTDLHSKLSLVMETIRRAVGSACNALSVDRLHKSLDVGVLISAVFGKTQLRLGTARELLSIYYPLVK